MEKNPKIKWYIVQVASGKEAIVMNNLKDKIRFNKVADKFGEIIVPTEEVVEMKGGQKYRSKRKFFPGYVLVQMEMDDEIWHLVKNITWVLGFVGGSGNKPVPISDKEMDEILNRVQEGVEKPKPKVLFVAGEVVRIVSGPFAEFDGVVDVVNYEKNRLVVSVLIFGRSTPVELEFNQVQKA